MRMIKKKKIIENIYKILMILKMKLMILNMMLKIKTLK